MAKKNKKRKRRLNREELRQTIAPTKDFEFVNPHDADDIIIVTAQRLSPGHLLEIDSSSLIKAHQQASNKSKGNGTQSADEPDTVEPDTDEPDTVDPDILDNLDEIVSNLKHSAKIASIAIIDPETGKRLYTEEDCMYYLMPAWAAEIAKWAVAGAVPQEGENADDADRFPAPDGEQEASAVEAETG